jgi:hypothetical protein
MPRDMSYNSRHIFRLFASESSLPYMSAAPLPDGEFFQSQPPRALTAQETGIEPHTLYRLVQIQALIASPEKDSNHIMHMIAECARDVAHATWIGIGILEEGLLICRAGVGTAATSIHNLTAVLTSSDNCHPGSEILRVENAEADSQIEANICRQLEASALLILPIYQGHTLAGVFAVVFAEAHTFANQEVGAYQLMTSLVAESISAQVEKEVEYKQSATQSTVPHAILRMTSEMRKARPQFRRESQRPTETVGALEVPAASVRNMSSWSLLRAGTLITQVFKRPSLGKFHWKLKAVPVVIMLIVVGGWIAYRHRPLPVSAPVIQKMVPAKLQLPPTPKSDKPTKTRREGKRSARKSAFKRKRIGQNEVDYMTDDVTIRQFGPIDTPKERRGRKKQDVRR